MDDVAFHEVLHLRRGPAGRALFLVSAGVVLIPPVSLPAKWAAMSVSLGLVMAIATWFAGTETTITKREITLVRRPYPRPRRIRLADIVAADVVIADANTTYFGGWEGSRGGLGGALVESLEGPQQVGNRSIRLQLSSGRRVQFATWRPRSALAAIRG